MLKTTVLLCYVEARRHKWDSKNPTNHLQKIKPKPHSPKQRWCYIPLIPPNYSECRHLPGESSEPRNWVTIQSTFKAFTWKGHSFWALPLVFYPIFFTSFYRFLLKKSIESWETMPAATQCCNICSIWHVPSIICWLKHFPGIWGQQGGHRLFICCSSNPVAITQRHLWHKAPSQHAKLDWIQETGLVTRSTGTSVTHSAGRQVQQCNFSKPWGNLP